MFLPSPLKIQGYGITDFSFTTDRDYDPEGEIDYDALNLNVERSYKTNIENPSLHFVRIKIFITPKEKGTFPYNISLDIGGVFEAKATERCPDEKLKGVVYVNGPTILYGIAREYLFMATCHNMCGPFMLPSVSFAPQPPPQKNTIQSKKNTQS